MAAEKIDDLSASRRASDGSVEWRCKCCLLFRKPEEFKRTDKRRGYVCNACSKIEVAETASRSDTVLFFLERTPWAPINRARWEKAIWRGIKLHQRPVDTRETMVKRVLGGKPQAMRQYRRGLMRVLAETSELTPFDYFWLLLRSGLVPKHLARALSVGAAKYAVRISGLEHPKADEVLFDMRHIAFAGEGSAHDARKAVYEIGESLDNGEFHPPAQFKAVQALAALCFPSSEEALLGTVNWTVEAYLAKLDLLEKRPNQVVERESAIGAILSDLTTLFMPLAQDWSEEQDEAERRNVNRFKEETPDDDDDDVYI